MKEIKKEESPAERPLNRMTVRELREIARTIPGITGVHAMKKEELVAVIMEARGITDEAPARKRTRKSGKPTLSVKGLKKKMAHLRAEKEAAQREGNRKEAEVLRRRISRLKKRTRRIGHA